MPRLSEIAKLAPEDLKAFELELSRRHFGDYDGLVKWLAERGYEISRSVAHRHGQKVKRRLEAVKASTEAARLIAEAAPDDADQRSAAVIAMVQSEMFQLLLNLQEAEEESDPIERVELMAKAARGMADLSRASIAQKKWQSAVREKLESKLAGLEAEAAGGKPGARRLDAETLRIVRQEVYGLV
jgi:hypothetical protein